MFENVQATQCIGRDFRIEDETFSKQNVSVGESLEIMGSIVSISQDQLELDPWAVIRFSDQSSFANSFSSIFSETPVLCKGGTSDGNLNWYFKISSEPLEPFTLEPGDEVPYSITLVPQKSGTYNIRSAMLFDDVYRAGPGQTITVEGYEGLTDGELFGFYLPFFTSIFLIAFGIITGIILIRRKFSNKPKSWEKLS